MISVTFTIGENSYTTSEIIRDSVHINWNHLKGLKSSSSQATFTLKRGALVDGSGDPSLIGLLFTESNDIKVTLQDGTTPLFTGYLAKNKSYSVRNIGLSDISLTINDIGLKLLKAESPVKSYIYEEMNLSTMVADLVTNAGCDWNDDNPEIDEYIHLYTNGEQLDSLISHLLYEYGYYYYFNEEGKFTIAQINLDSEATPSLTLKAKPTASTDKPLYTKSGSAIQMTRAFGEYDTASVSYKELQHYTGRKLYEVQSVHTSQGHWWDGNDHTGVSGSIISGEDWSSTINLQFWEKKGFKFKIATSSIADGSYVTVSAKYKEQVLTQELVSLMVHNKYKVYLADDDKKRLSNAVTVDGGTYHTSWKTRKNVKLTVTKSDASKVRYLMFENGNALKILNIKELEVEVVASDAGIKPGNTELQDLKEGYDLYSIEPDTWELEVVAGPLSTQTTLYEGDYFEPNELNPLTLDVLSNALEESHIYSKVVGKADCWLVKSVGNAYSGKDNVVTANTYREDSKYLLSNEDAQAHANRLATYYGYCQTEYTFFSSEDISCGSVVQVVDNLYSGLNTKVFITQKSSDYGKSVITYKGYALSDIGVISLSQTPTMSTIVKINGAKGDSVEIEYALGSSLTQYPTTGWSTSQPTPTTALPYVWRRERIVEEE